jgi:hypothetical protein
MRRDNLIKEKAKATLKDEPAILRSNPDISGLSGHVEYRELRENVAKQKVFDFFKTLGINTEFRISDSITANSYIWASYLNIKNEVVTVSFSYYESPITGVHRTLSIYKNGLKKSNIRELRKLYSE